MVSAAYNSRIKFQLSAQVFTKNMLINNHLTYDNVIFSLETLIQ